MNMIVDHATLIFVAAFVVGVFFAHTKQRRIFSTHLSNTTVHNMTSTALFGTGNGCLQDSF